MKLNFTYKKFVTNIDQNKLTPNSNKQKLVGIKYLGIDIWDLIIRISGLSGLGLLLLCTI
jgi:hypothetical protein